MNGWLKLVGAFAIFCAASEAQIVQQAVVNTPKPSGAVTNVVTYATNGCTSTTPVTTEINCTTTSNMTANESTIVDVQWFAAVTVTSIAPATGTCSLLGGPTTWQGGAGFDEYWLCSGATAGSTLNIQINFSGSIAVAFPQMGAAVFVGTVSAPVADGSPATPAQGATNTTGTSNNVTTTIANEMIVAPTGASGTITPGTTPQAMTAAQTVAADDVITYGTAVTAGLNFATFTQTVNGFWVIQLVALI